jgi:hypothetical protein
MTLLLAEGFDQYGTTDDDPCLGIDERYPVTAGGTPVVKAGRLFGKAIGNSSGVSNFTFRTEDFGNKTTLVVGLAFYADNLHSDRLITFFEPGRGDGFNVRLTSGGAISVVRENAATLGTSAAIVSPDTWYYLEVKVTIGNAGAGAYEVRLNGVDILSDTDADTMAGSVAGVNQVQFHVRISNNTFYDDMYILDTSGSVNNDFLGDCRCETLYPNAVGSSSDFTPSEAADNYTLVADQGFDGDDTYVESTTPGDLDLYEFTNITASELIHGLQFTVIARKTDVTDFDIVLRLDGLGASGVTVNSTDYASFSQMYETNPDTTLPWIDTEINGSEFGYEVD